jgi:hypothetical protein
MKQQISKMLAMEDNNEEYGLHIRAKDEWKPNSNDLDDVDCDDENNTPMGSMSTHHTLAHTQKKHNSTIHHVLCT